MSTRRVVFLVLYPLLASAIGGAWILIGNPNHLVLLIYTVLTNLAYGVLAKSSRLERRVEARGRQEVARRRELGIAIMGAAVTIFFLANVLWAKTLGYTVWALAILSLILVAVLSATTIVLG